MSDGKDFNETKRINDSVKYSQDVVTNGASAAAFGAGGVPEDRTRYVTSLILTEQAGSASRVTLSKEREGNSAEAIVSGVNVPADENVTFSTDDQGVFLPRFEGGTNLTIETDTSAVGATTFFYDNEV